MRHAMELVVRHDHGATVLAAPAPGVFRPLVRVESFVATGDVLGTLAVLDRELDLVVPAGVRGYVGSPHGSGAVGYGDALAVIEARSSTSSAATDAPDAPAHEDAHGLVFRAPTSGRYYGRPTPDKPPFLAQGAELQPGTTICLLEVMKTFNRVAYHGAPARVKQLLVADGADVNAGDPLVALEAL